MPATKVPWPRPSPAVAPGSVARSTEATIRDPKSLRFWMPESTTAIEGCAAAKPGSLSFAQLSALFDSYGHTCDEEKLVLVFAFVGADVEPEDVEEAGLPSCTGRFGVIESSPPFFAALATRRRICLPLSVAATPVIDENWAVTCCLRT